MSRQTRAQMAIDSRVKIRDTAAESRLSLWHRFKDAAWKSNRARETTNYSSDAP